MRKNIYRIVKPIAYITATTLITATLFACGSKDDTASKIKNTVEADSVSENTDIEKETETSIVTEVDDNGEEVTRVVTVVQTEDGTKKVVDNNNTSSSNNNGSASENKTSSGNNNSNSSTQKPNGGNSGNSGNGSNGGSSSGNNTQSGGNDGNNSNSSSNNTETKKPVTSSGNNSGGNTGSSNNAGTTTTAATEGNIWAYYCTGKPVSEEMFFSEDREHYDFTDGSFHKNVSLSYSNGGNGYYDDEENAINKDEYHDTTGYTFYDESVIKAACADYYYYVWATCKDCGHVWKTTSALEHTTPTASHSYVDVMTRPATYGWSAWYEKQCTKCQGTAQSDTYVPHLKWWEDYCESYTGLNGLETYNDSSVCQYDKELTDLSMCDHYVEGIDWNTGLVADNYINCSFSYIYKCDSAGNPIYKKTILGYDKNGNAIWNDRPYWVAQHDSGAKILYLTLEDARKRNVLYDWENRDASGKEY